MASVIDQPPATGPRPEPERIRLSDVSWDVYTALRDIEANEHIRMSYFHGTLEVMSPQFRPEKGECSRNKRESVDLPSSTRFDDPGRKRSGEARTWGGSPLQVRF